jgi:hypothetical protein
MASVVIDPRLSAHAVNSAGKWTGSVVKVLPVETFQARWGALALKAGDLYYQISRLWFLDEDEAEGKTIISVYLEDQNGDAMTPGKVWWAYPSERLVQSSWAGKFDNGAGGNGEVFTYINGNGELGMGGGHGFNPSPGTAEAGCYVLSAFGYPSEVAYGFDLPANRHVSYIAKFRLAVYGEVTPEPTPTPTPEPTPTPTPEPGAVVDWLAFCERLAAAAEAWAAMMRD